MLYSLCRYQERRAGMDGTVVGLDYTAVIMTLKLYIKPDELKSRFEEVLLCWNMAQQESRIL